MNDNDLRVFAVPVKFTVEGTVYILARAFHQAAQRALKINLEDYIAFTPSAIRTDDEGILKISDVLTSPLNVSIVDITELTTEEYPPNRHPDFVGIRR